MQRSRSGVTPWVLRLNSALAVLLAFTAFTLSFDALRQLAIEAKIRESIAWMWPVTVDGFIVLATSMAMTMRDQGARRWYPWVTLMIAAGISVGGNGIHAASAPAPPWISVGVAVAVSAVPPIMLLLASHMIVLGVPTVGSVPNGQKPSPAPPSTLWAYPGPRACHLGAYFTRGIRRGTSLNYTATC